MCDFCIQQQAKFLTVKTGKIVHYLDLVYNRQMADLLLFAE